MNISNSNKIAYGFYLVSLAVFLLLYSQVLNFGYIWDDAAVVISNPLLMGRELTWSLLAQPVLEGTSYFRPLAFLSWYWERQVFGLNPVVSHAINAFTFYGSTLFLFHLARRILKSYSYADGFAAAAALIFLCHPRNVEAVAWISGRFDVFATFFLLAGCYGLVGIQHKWLRCLWVAVCHIAALSSKEIGILMPFVLVCVWMLSEHQNHQPWKPTLWSLFRKNSWLAIILVVDTFIYLYLRSRYASGMSHTSLSWIFIRYSYFESLLPIVTLKEYIVRTLLPFYDMGVIFPIEPFVTLLNKMVSVLVVGALLAAVIWGAYKRYTIICAAIAYVIMLSLVLYFLPITTTGITQDRFLMSALPFFCIGVTYLLQQAALRWYHIKAYVAGLVVYLVAISVITAQIVPIWANSLVFWVSMSEYQEKYTHDFHPMLIYSIVLSNLPDNVIQQQVEALIQRERAKTKKTGTFRPLVYIMYAQYLITKKDPKGVDIMGEYIDALADKSQVQELSRSEVEGIYTAYARGMLLLRHDVDKADKVFELAKSIMTKNSQTVDVMSYNVIFDLLKGRNQQAKESYQALLSLNFNSEVDKNNALFTIDDTVNQVCRDKKLTVLACQSQPFRSRTFFQ